MYICRLIDNYRLILHTRFFLLFFVIDVNDFAIQDGDYIRGGVIV